MSILDLNHLELQIETLLQTHKKLVNENLSLRQKLIKLTQERAELVDKNKKAATKLKRILVQLRNEIQ